MKLREELSYKKLILISLTLFIILGFLVNSTSYLDGIDKAILEYMVGDRNRFLIAIASIASAIGSAWGYIAIGLLVLNYSIKYKRLNRFKLYTLTAIATSSLNQIIKLFYGRERPLVDYGIDVSGYSFPSGHAMAAMSIYISISYILLNDFPKYRKLIYSISVFAVIAIGWARLYLGVHWITDIIGGYLGGLTVVLMTLNVDFEKK